MKQSRFLRMFSRVRTPEDPPVEFWLDGEKVALVSVSMDIGRGAWEINLTKRSDLTPHEVLSGKRASNG